MLTLVTNKKYTQTKQYNTVNTITHITKTPTQLTKQPHITKSTHTHTNTLQNPHIQTHLHITKQVRTNIVQDTHQIKWSQYDQLPSI